MHWLSADIIDFFLGAYAETTTLNSLSLSAYVLSGKEDQMMERFLSGTKRTIGDDGDDGDGDGDDDDDDTDSGVREDGSIDSRLEYRYLLANMSPLLITSPI